MSDLQNKIAGLYKCCNVITENCNPLHYWLLKQVWQYCYCPTAAIHSSDNNYRKRMLMLTQHRHVGAGTSPPHLRLFCLITFCQRPPTLMFSCTALHSWQCFPCDLKPFGLRSDSVLYVVWKLMLRSGNSLKCVHLRSGFLFCAVYWLLLEEVMSSSLTSATWFLPGTFTLVFWLSVFIPISFFRWAFSVTWHEPEWQLECEQKNSLSREIAVPHPWVLWHLSRGRELCLCEQYCSLQTKPHICTHNMRVVRKVHSLHPIIGSTPSHFLCSTLIYFW